MNEFKKANGYAIIAHNIVLIFYVKYDTLNQIGGIVINKYTRLTNQNFSLSVIPSKAEIQYFLLFFLILLKCLFSFVYDIFKFNSVKIFLESKPSGRI